MTHARDMLRRIEVNYAGVQGTYWMAMCAFSSYMAVYLGHRGFGDTQIGITAGLIAAFNIAFQLFISNYSDANQQVPIKRIIAGLYVVAIVLVSVLHLVPMTAGLVMLAYALAGGFGNTINGLLNAQIMQYVNVGIPVQYGWPRGFGSITYAVSALLLGMLLEYNAPTLLMPVFMLCAALAIAAVMWMPEVYTLSDRRAALYAHETGMQHTTYRALLKRSPVFTMFLLSGILLYVGQAGSLLFLVRVVQHAGGGNGELGIAMFIQGGIEMPVMFLAPRIFKRFKPGKVLVFSMVFYFIKSLVLLGANTMATVYIAMGLSIFCFGLYGVASVFFVDALVLPGEKVRAQGLTTLCGSFGGILSNLMSGMILDLWGLKTLLAISSVVMAASLALMVMCWRMYAGNKGFDRRPAA